MKARINKKYTLCTLLSLMVFFSCKYEAVTEASNKEFVTFSGIITNPNSDSLLVFNENYKKRIAVNQGIFHDTLHIDKKGTYRFYDGIEQSVLYLTKGDNLQLKLNTEQFDETIVYEGQGADVNNFLAQNALKVEETFNSIDLEDLNQEDLTNELTKVKDTLYKFIDSHDLPESLIKQEKDNIDEAIKSYQYYYEEKIAVKSEMTGKTTPLFTAYENIDGTKTSLNDLKGKYVYIDVWATWCAPCKHEIPYLKELEEKYRDKNIEFISISVDKAKDHEKWVKMINEKQLKGVQLFADNSFDSQFLKEYKINSIPRFILIDPQGMIVSPDTYRPSETEKIEQLFNSLEI